MNTVIMSKRQVTKEEFDKFIREYPNKLEVDVAVLEPPIKTWNDFSKADQWPRSVVAFCKMYDGSDYHQGKQPEYWIFNS